MKPVRHLSCATCKTGCIEYSGESDEIHCAECAQQKAMEYFGFSKHASPAMLPTYMFENVLDEMDRLMGREVKSRPRDWAKPKLAPPPTTEPRSRPSPHRPCRHSGSELFGAFVFVAFSFGLGFFLGWVARGGA